MRCSVESVRAVINTDESIELQQFMLTANALTDYVASQDEDGLLNSILLERIETYLAAHYYSLRDPQYKSKATGDASATYLDRDWWKEAQQLDITGTLAAVKNGHAKAEVIHLGMPASQVPDYWDIN